MLRLFQRVVRLAAPPELARPVLPERLRGKRTGLPLRSLRRLSLLLLLLALTGAAWFSCQVVLVPQPLDFPPRWGEARWVEASDAAAPVAYFRDLVVLSSQPDGASITLAADQIFALYVNGVYLGSNAGDFTPRVYIYDVRPALQVGVNAIALRIANADQRSPAVRASLEIAYGRVRYRYGTGAGWIATAQSALAHPRGTLSMRLWTMPGFGASGWLPVRDSAAPQREPLLGVNSQLYEQPLGRVWLRAGAGPDAYFVRQIVLPSAGLRSWLRLGASGMADVYVNGSLVATWERHPAPFQRRPQDLLWDDTPSAPSVSGMAVGLYDLSAWLHDGVNILAVHVSTTGIPASRMGSGDAGAALLTDLLLRDQQGGDNWLSLLGGWRAAAHAVEGWQTGEGAVARWPAAIPAALSSQTPTFFLATSIGVVNTVSPPLGTALVVSLAAGCLVLIPWLLLARGCLRLTRPAGWKGLERLSLAYLPALALEALLIILSRQPEIPRPFPYTWPWLLLLLLLVVLGFLALWLGERRRATQGLSIGPMPDAPALIPPGSSLKTLRVRQLVSLSIPRWREPLWSWAGPSIIVLLAAPLVFYNLAYEPFWQDELSSYYAAQGILAHALPFFPSGFLYAKAELYSYLLALWLKLFGNQPEATRAISATEYLLSLPLLYHTGRYFCGRRVALLATAMLAFSPFALVWSRQMRMYEQAQVFTLLAAYLFYRAVRRRRKPALVYLATLSLLLAYLSHEETFIVLPAFVIGLSLASRRKGRLLPMICYRKAWWGALLLSALTIGCQLLIARLSHPPQLGSDLSERPLVSLTMDNAIYYVQLLFLPTGSARSIPPWSSLNSVLALIGSLLALRRGDRRASYCALFLIIALLTLIYGFTFQADRYVYPLLPFYYLLGAYALIAGLDACRDLLSVENGGLVTRRHDSRRLPWGEHILLVGSSGLLCVAVLATPLIPVSGNSLALSRVVGLSYHRHYADYDALAQYLQRHLQKGDAVIAIAPANCVLYYARHVDYFFSIDRALYLMEHEGSIIETASGAEALLSQRDFEAVLAAYPRVWIVSDGGPYEFAVRKRFVFPPDVHLVFEGYASALYLRGG